MDKTMSKILRNHKKWSRIAISIVLIGTSWQYFAVFVQQMVHIFGMVNRNESWLSLETSYLCFERRESLHTKEMSLDLPHYEPCLNLLSIHLVTSSGAHATRWSRQRITNVWILVLYWTMPELYLVYEMPGCGCGSVLHSCVIVAHLCDCLA